MEETAEVDITASGVHHNVTDLGFIGSGTVKHAQATIDTEVWGDFICSTELETEVVLSPLHIAIHIITCGAEGLQLVGNASDNALKGTESVGKLTFTAAAWDGEIELYTPVSLIIGSLQ